MYSLIRKALFTLSPETSHDLGLDLMGATNRLGLGKLLAAKNTSLPTELMGLTFDNPVGLAAGLDKNGDYINALAALGFGFIEIGTVTPRPQPGNPKPRLFRIPERMAIINRMGFNNKGVDYLVEQVKKAQFKGVLGINIGKNKTTPEQEAVDDYLICLKKVYPYASYITVNISSPNTPGLRDMQFGESLAQLISSLKQAQQDLEKEHGVYKPILIKIAPDMNEDEVKQVGSVIKEGGMDGIIATNTTLSREAVEGLKYGDEAGGLSGAPLTDKSTEVIEILRNHLGEGFPIIGVGGIVDGESAAEKRAAGADLVQIYSGFIYEGPQLISKAVDALR